MSENWKTKRIRLVSLLILLSVALAGVYAFEHWAAEGEDVLAEAEVGRRFLPPADIAEAEALMNKEVEAGRENREPGTFAFVFRETGLNEVCAWFCVDMAVAAGLDVHLISADGKFCTTKTLEPVLFKGEAYEFPATPLEQNSDCDSLGETELAVFGQRPQFEWLELNRSASSAAEDLDRFVQDEKLKVQLIDEASRAEGGSTLSRSSRLLPPEVGVLKTSDGDVTLMTWRWSDPNVNTEGDEVSRGSTYYSFSGSTPERVMDNGLFCSEVPTGFRMNGEVYILLREWGCNSGISCRGLLRWSKDHFETAYGNCNFST